MNELPLVSCIMPTRNRTRFVERSIDYFLKQDYPNKELIICEEESASFDSLVLPEGVHYFGYSWRRYKSLGEKRNVMCEHAKGSLIAHWDDDDWHAPNRLSTQIKHMQLAGARLSGCDRLVFYNGSQAWLFRTPRQPWLAGGTLVYEKSLWQEQPFDHVSDGEDTAFVDAAFWKNVPVVIVDDRSLYVAMLHESNTTKRDPSRWRSFDVQQVRSWIEG